MKPDKETEERLENLAPVGRLLKEISNDLSEDSYFMAKSSLGRFKEGIQKLEIRPPVMEGMMDLIDYLEEKIEKRKRQALGEFSKD